MAIEEKYDLLVSFEAVRDLKMTDLTYYNHKQ